MNVISSIFQNPDSARDRKQIDLLERVSPESVRKIGTAKSRKVAENEIERLRDGLEGIKNLTEDQVRSLQTWLNVVLFARAPSELAGLHFSGEA
jgi:hypothetical protein